MYESIKASKHQLVYSHSSNTTLKRITTTNKRDTQPEGSDKAK